MEKQFIISVGREFGSAGHVIAGELAIRFGLELYDKNLLKCVAEDREVDSEALEKYDERPKRKLFSRKVKGHSNSPEEHVANMQFDFLKKMAAEGKSFVIVGRCAEQVLKEYEGLITLFVLGDSESKAERIMKLHGLSRERALALMAKEDRKRKSYHNYYCEGKWGDSRNYDLCVNSSKLGVEKTANMLEAYIRERCGN